MDTAAPLLHLSGVVREYPSGDGVVAVLRDVELTIRRGEMVAIMGPSGSGKSTLMNIIGCLDQPSRGSYRVEGEETRDMSPDALAELRREHFGFVFQRYQLIRALSAQANVEIPAIYADTPPAQRAERARQLLQRLGLGERTQHRPGQLSGGQQQRVSIARSLMNGGQILLADEPTGALDSQSGIEVMAILRELNDAGHTIILVTHDAEVAAQAHRVIRIHDGRIVADDGPDTRGIDNARAHAPPARAPGSASLAVRLSRFSEAMQMGLRSMVGNRLRTFLTMLGIIIGIASVIVVVALGTGSKDRILADLNTAGANTIEVHPGSGPGDRKADSIRTLVPADAEALATLPGVLASSPIVQTNQTARVENREKTVSVSGVGADYPPTRALTLARGQWFGAASVRAIAQDAVIDANAHKALFGNRPDVIGQTLMLGSTPVRVVGVTGKSESPFGGDRALNIWLPYTTVMARISGSHNIASIVAALKPDAVPKEVERDVQRTLTIRHGRQDFYTQNSEKLREMVEKTMATMTLLISSIALISLVVGGIGVMNIMLVSVTERTQEIGVRMAVGARQGDILRQFLIEAISVCLVGGLLGIALAFGIGALFSLFFKQFAMVFSPSAILVAVACSSLIGAVFGYLPARNAARLNPVEALARE
ncbi:MacB family efflux pump subunit [Lysobacter pythonis]|uniref:Pyoverdine export ATP-binding/permease protein PvdT n=1 Tax=Solilutibacter pythonis TaxID=2483112 RepID=A0A3M2HXQ1_9GAMM|nr:MacB family efflux pump subunit [Lysobacter pythonis]RMH90957.1 MacB family efflux pump subunit [Lysobacter pythonis]